MRPQHKPHSSTRSSGRETQPRELERGCGRRWMSGNLRSIDAVFVLVQSQSRGFLDPWQSHLLAQGLPDLLGIWQRAMLPSVHRTFWHWMPGPPALITTYNQLLARSSRCANSWLYGLGALSPRLSFFFTSTAQRWPSDLESDQVHPIKSTGRSRTREKSCAFWRWVNCEVKSMSVCLGQHGFYFSSTRQWEATRTAGLRM